jgi:putative inorganic carbon (HCO3(-)) transporter
MPQSIKNLFSKLNSNRMLEAVLAILIVLAFSSLIAAIFIPVNYVLAFDAAAIVLAVAVWRPMIGVYAMAAFYPFVGWQFRWGDFNAPYIDLVALIVFCAFILRGLIEHRNLDWNFFKKIFPGAILFLLFFAVSAIAMINNADIWTGVKYLLRPLLYFYLMFVVIPWNAIDSKKVFFRICRIFFFVGVAVALLGVLSLIFSAGPWYTHRAVPYQIGDFNPLGGNQNAVAEVLLVTVPIGLLLYFNEPEFRKRNYYIVAIASLAIVLLLTFSRSGWLGLMLEMAIIWGVRQMRNVKKETIIGVALAVLVAVPLLYFSIWNQLDWVSESNRNRMLMTDIALSHFYNQPFFGNGLNTFQTLVGGTFVYSVEFGDPLESHGFLQKTLVESGLLGTLAFLSILGWLFFIFLTAYNKASDEKHRLTAMCLLMMFCGLLMMELFSTSYFIATMWLPLGVGLAGTRLIREKSI